MEVLRRSFEHVSLSHDGDGRTIIGRVVPYNVAARVSDNGGPVYEEAFAPGAFARMARAPHRVSLVFEHRGGIMDHVGKAAAFEDRPDGLWGSFRATRNSPVADQALAMIADDEDIGFSVGFVPLSTRNGAHGLQVRTRCHLEEVSLVRDRAYEDATIASVRSAPLAVGALSHELAALRPPRDAALDERLQALRAD